MTVSAPGTPTLEQLHVLAAVVDAGSFSAAARLLHRAQSVVSYNIAALEGQLGLPLFQRGRRRPVLTEAGRAVLADARRIAGLVNELRARAAGLKSGLEPEVSLAVDVMFPQHVLVAGLQDFARAFPTVVLRLRIEALGGVAQSVLDGACGLGIAGWLNTRLDALRQRQIGTIQLVPVAAPSHPLARLPPPIATAAARDHVQLVLTDRSRLSAGQDFAVLALRTWRLTDLGAKHALLRAGLGWGHMPELMVRDDLADRRLVRLVLAETADPPYPLSLIHRVEHPARPGSRLVGPTPGSSAGCGRSRRIAGQEGAVTSSRFRGRRDVTKATAWPDNRCPCPNLAACHGLPRISLPPGVRPLRSGVHGRVALSRGPARPLPHPNSPMGGLRAWRTHPGVATG